MLVVGGIGTVQLYPPVPAGTPYTVVGTIVVDPNVVWMNTRRILRESRVVIGFRISRAMRDHFLIFTQPREQLYLSIGKARLTVGNHLFNLSRANICLLIIAYFKEDNHEVF